MGEMHASHDVDDVDVPNCRAKIADFVRERDHRREQCIRRVLDHLGRSGVGQQSGHAWCEGSIELFQSGVGPLIDSAQDQAVCAQSL